MKQESKSRVCKFIFFSFTLKRKQSKNIDFLFPVSVAQKTTEQANVVADTAVSEANEVAQAAVQGVENAAAATGFVSTVSDVSLLSIININENQGVSLLCCSYFIYITCLFPHVTDKG